MRAEKLTLNVPTLAATAGTPLRVDRYRDKTIQLIDVAATFSGSIDIEGSLDGTNYFAVITGITGPQISNIHATLLWLRVKLVSLSAGGMTGVFHGFDSRTDGG